jgi:hypothetical protein
MVAWLTFLCMAISLTACMGREPTPKTLVAERCIRCHTLAPIEVSHKTYQEWERTVFRMMDKGARLDSREAKAVIDYLSQIYGSEPR